MRSGRIVSLLAGPNRVGYNMIRKFRHYDFNDHHSCNWTRNEWFSIWINQERSFSSRLEAQSTLIGRALRSTRGRIQLAEAMVEPLRNILTYEGIGRSVLKVENLPPSATSPI